MNARERMARAMARRTPDRVPLMCQLSLGHYFLQCELDAIEIWHDSEAFAQALVSLQRRYGFDGILVNLPGRDPAWRDAIHRVEADPDEERARRVTWKDGSYTVVPEDDSPRVYTVDGERPFPTFAELDPAGLYYVEPHDRAGVRRLRAFPPWQSRTLELVRAHTRGEVSVHAEVFSPFSQLMELCDTGQGLLALIDDAAKVRACLDRLAQGALALARLYAQSGCDAILVSSAFAGAGLISRDHYRSFEQPSLTKLVAGIHESHPELPVYVHTCGAIGDRLELIEECGIDGIDTLDPPPLGTVDLVSAVERLGKRVFIKGNIDPVSTLLEGSVEDCREAALERLAIAKPGGAFVLSSACAVAPRTPPANLIALRAAIAEAGSYA